MEKKEYLNEESYQTTKKKISIIALIVLIVGVLLGGSLIVTGIVKSAKIDSSTTVRSKEEIEAEIDELEAEIAKLKVEQNAEFSQNQFSEKFYLLGDQVSKKEGQVADLETEIWKMETPYNSASNSIAKSKYIPLYFIGTFIIIASCMISGSIFMFSKRREITAFTAQQVMPVAQEGIEKMAPTIGDAGKTIVKEIVKGIKEGKDE